MSEALPGGNPLGVQVPTLEKLLDDLQEFIQETLKNYRLDVKQEGWNNQPLERDVEVSQMIMPDPDEEHERIPYILLQLLNGSDKRNERGQMESKANVRIVIAIYNPDKLEGRLQVLRIIQKIRYEIHKAGVIGKMFKIGNLEYLIYPDDTQSYHMGEMSTDWTIPPVERDLTRLVNRS